MAHTYEYPRPSVTVDCVVFGFDPHNEADPLKILLVRRKDEPFKGQCALPGGFVEVSDKDGQGESLEEAARRELQEETGIRINFLEQLYTFGTPGRDPRGRVISVAYYALVRSRDYIAMAGSDASEAFWDSARKDQPLAFDHKAIVDMAVERLRSKIRYTPIGFHLLPKTFTLAELRALYEALLGRKLDQSNFRKKMLATEVLVESGEPLTGSHRPSPRYRFDKTAYDRAVREGFNFVV